MADSNATLTKPGLCLHDDDKQELANMQLEGDEKADQIEEYDQDVWSPVVPLCPTPPPLSDDYGKKALEVLATRRSNKQKTKK